MASPLLDRKETANSPAGFIAISDPTQWQLVPLAAWHRGLERDYKYRTDIDPDVSLVSELDGGGELKRFLLLYWLLPSHTLHYLQTLAQGIEEHFDKCHLIHALSTSSHSIVQGLY
jgi:hypothetical protein